jgi:RNA polymerase sigma-70 factor, ECF subfamily
LPLFLGVISSKEQRGARPGERTDPALVEACRRGDRRALEQVFRAESPSVERLIARIIGPSADVEDLLQTTLLEAVRAFPRFRGEASVRTWLARIAVHVVHAHLRRPDRKRRVDLQLAERPADTPSADVLVDRRRQLERALHALDRLSAKNRIAFILHVFEGYPIDEVAALVGASRVATKSRVFLARRRLLAFARKDRVLKSLFEDGGEP